jgi:hypothetical protein
MSDFIEIVIGQLVLFVLYKGTVIISTKQRISNYEYYFLFGCVIVMLIGLAQFAMYFLFGSNWGTIPPTPYVPFPRPFSLTLEPDWYGFVCMILSLLLIYKLVDIKPFFSVRIDFFLAILSISGMILSMARASLLGFIVGLLLYLFGLKESKKRKVLFKYLLMFAILLLIVAIILLLVKPQTILSILKRINIMESMKYDGGAANTRIYSIEIMWKYFLYHPLIGNGVGGMNYISNNATLLRNMGYHYTINKGSGNANIILVNLFDVGISGTIAIFLFFFSFMRKLRLAYITSKDNMCLLYFCLFAAILVVFQFNNGIRLSYIWILIGFAMKRSELSYESISIHKMARQILSTTKSL